MAQNKIDVAALKLRGDAALTILQAMLSGIVTTQKKLAEMQQVIEQALEVTEQFDRDNGLLVGEKSSLQQEMLAVLRRQMPHLADKSDEEIISQFGGGV